MLSYKQEFLACESRLLEINTKSGGIMHTFASLDVVWHSLTTNSQMILYKIAKIYYLGKRSIEFFDLFRRAK